MKHPKSELYFLLALIGGILLLTFFIFKPFLYALILAIIFTTVFRPIHSKISRTIGNKGSIAALLTTLSVLIIVIVPVAFLSIQIFQESTTFYSSLVTSGGTNGLSQIINDTIENVTSFSPVPIEFNVDINQYLRLGLNWLLDHLGDLFANVARIALATFIFLIATYYLFKDGHKFKDAIVLISPLQDIHDETIFSRLSLAVNSVIKGSLVVALVQGILTAIGFTIFGVPNVALWGSVAAVAALIPGVGTALVLLPAILFLYVTGKLFAALGLLVWGLVAVGLVDNFLGPKLVERGVQIHPFLILLSILGGLSFFGPIGFILGPITLSLLFTLLSIYSSIRKEHGAL